jgi:hypothetical protein
MPTSIHIANQSSNHDPALGFVGTLGMPQGLVALCCVARGMRGKQGGNLAESDLSNGLPDMA